MDLIYRASVLKAIDEYERLSAVSQTVRNMTSLREIVQWLPAVQPQTEEDCDTCKHGFFGNRQCDNCRVRFPSHYERKEEHHGSD